MNVSIKLKNRNEFNGKSEDLLLRRRKRSFRRAGGKSGKFGRRLMFDST